MRRITINQSLSYCPQIQSLPRLSTFNMFFKISTIVAAALWATTANAAAIEARQAPAGCTFVVTPSGTPNPSANLSSEWNYRMPQFSLSIDFPSSENLTVVGRTIANYFAPGTTIYPVSDIKLLPSGNISLTLLPRAS